MMKTALLFAGQGSQTVGMGRDLCEKHDVCRQLFAHANAVLGRDLQKICFEGPEDVLTKTDNAQPAIFLTSLACLEALKSQVPDLNFDATAGLSLGEFTALTAADAVSFRRWLAHGASARTFHAGSLRFDQWRHGVHPESGRCDTGGSLPRSRCGYCQYQLSRPDRDFRRQGKNRARRSRLAKARGAKRAIPLVVAGAYHSRLMEGAKVKVADALAGFPMQLPKVPVVSNVTARPGGGVAEIKELLVRQVTSSVRWSESMQWLVSQGFTRFIELGPGNVLSGLMKRINKDVEMLSVSDGATLDATAAKLRA